MSLSLQKLVRNAGSAQLLWQSICAQLTRLVGKCSATYCHRCCTVQCALAALRFAMSICRPTLPGEVRKTTYACTHRPSRGETTTGHGCQTLSKLLEHNQSRRPTQGTASIPQAVHRVYR